MAGQISGGDVGGWEAWRTQLAEMFGKLNPVDQFLLCLLVAALFVKLISALSVPVISWWIKSKTDDRPCEFLRKNSGGKYICGNIFYKKKNFDSQRTCPRSRCHGYQPEGVNVKNIIDSCRPLKMMYALSDWFAQGTSVILIIRTLLEVHT